jgi:hypothetical protein
MSFTDCNGYPMTCLDLAQYVVYTVSVIAQSDTLPAFYMQTVLIFLIIMLISVILGLSNINGVRFVAFPVTEYDEVFLGYQPGQMVER